MLKFGTPHHAVWRTICEAKGEGLTAAQISARDHNYHPQVLADLQKAKLVGKIGKNGNEFRYAADPAGRGIIAQEIRIVVSVYETEDGKFLAKADVIGKASKHGKVTRLLGHKKFNYVVPEINDPTIIDLPPTEFANIIEPARRLGLLSIMTDADRLFTEGDKSTIIEG